MNLRQGINTTVLILPVIISLYLIFRFIPLANLSWDESVFLNRSYRTYLALKESDLNKLVSFTSSQFDYPPMQSLFTGTVLVPFGYSVEKARVVNLFWFIFSAYLVFLLGKKIGGKRKIVVGLISFFLFIFSPMTLLFSVIAVKEMMGTTFSLLAVFYYIKAREAQSPNFYAACGLILLILTMTKYNYGGLIFIAIFFEFLFEFISNKDNRREIFSSHILLFEILLVPLILWIFLPTNKLSYYWQILSNPFYLAATSNNLNYLLFYPRAILFLYSQSMSIGILILFSVTYSSLKLKIFPIRILWLCFIINFVLGEIHVNNLQERFIFTTVPFAYIVTSYIFLSFLLPKLTRFKIIFLISVISLVVLINLVNLERSVVSVASYTLKSPIFNQPDYKDLYFDYDKREWGKLLPTPQNQKIHDVIEYLARSIDLSKKIEIVGYSNELPPESFALYFDLKKSRGDYPRLSHLSYLVTLEIFPGSRFFTKDYSYVNAWAIPRIREVQKDKSLTLLSRKKFEELGIEVTIYDKRQ